MDDTEVKDRLIIFVRYPQAGRVKIRLAKAIGSERAAELYRCFAEDTLARAAKGSWQTEIHFSPPESRRQFEEWLGDGQVYLPQQGADLGLRMSHAFEDCFARGTQKAILIGTDLPDLPAEFLRLGFEELEHADIVLGPAADGGYYLVGFTREAFAPAVFDEIDWGTGRVLMQTIAKLQTADKSAALLPRWRDVDTPEDLQSLRVRCETNTADCPQTARWLASHF